MLNSKWFLEVSTPKEVNLHALEGVLYSSVSKYQKVEILKLASFGTALVLDGKIQSAEYDEFIYHEALIQPALITSTDPKKVLIAGGGEGASVRETLKHPSIQSVSMVDLDKEVVDICKKHLTSWHQGAFDDSKVDVYYEDARGFIKESTDTFDVIILDLPEPEETGPAVNLYTSDFYEEVFEKLGPDGIVVTQATSVAVNNIGTYTTIFNSLKSVFPLVRGYWVSVPSFYTPWGFVFASKGADPLLLDKNTIGKKIAALTKKLRFYDHETHNGIFSLPKYLREAIDKETRINTDASPISFY